jgi:hypothetical protein
MPKMKRCYPTFLAIASIWAAVAVVGVRGGDVATVSRHGDRTNVPVVAGVALFAPSRPALALIGLRKC